MHPKDLIIRPANSGDYPEIYHLLDEAFKDDPESNHNEAQIVKNLKASKGFIPDFSLVAKLGDVVAGYLLLTPITIENSARTYEALALAPVAVLPSWQLQGIGSALIEKAHEIAREKGYLLIVLIGHDTYYPRFGYKEARLFNINVPFDIPSRFVMVKELKQDAGKNISGRVKYPVAFYL